MIFFGFVDWIPSNPKQKMSLTPSPPSRIVCPSAPSKKKSDIHHTARSAKRLDFGGCKRVSPFGDATNPFDALTNAKDYARLQIAEVMKFLVGVFAEMRKKPCDPANPLVNRIQYVQFENDMFHLMVSSLIEPIFGESGQVLSRQWVFKIVQFSVAEEYRRKGLCTAVFDFCMNHTPTSYIMVECVTTEEMKKFCESYRGGTAIKNYTSYFFAK